MKKLLAFFAFILISQVLPAQSTFAPYNRDYYHLIDRLSIKYGSQLDFFQNTHKPLQRSYISDLILKANEFRDGMSSQDLFNLDYLSNDNWMWTKSKTSDSKKTLWDLFYLKKSDLYYYNGENFKFHLNPVIDFTFGKDSDNDETLFTNTRGAEAYGSIDGKIGFYSFLSTTQSRFAQYVFDYVRGDRAFPNEGFWKNNDNNDFDLLHARGYLTFNLTKSIGIQAGYDKNFIGNGLRSMVLSDFSSPYLFLKLQTRVGRFQYTNIFSQLTEDIIFANGVSPGDGNYPTKFMSFHRLGVNISKSVEIGLFETVILPKADINLFNPVIFYRAIEQQRGSPGNTLLGLDFKVNVKDKYSFYGQFLIDEFVIDALRSGNGDWRNKFGVQLGVKYIDAFNVNTLDLQVEYNIARPYFYAYDDPALSYTNYRNPLAHPLGANFKELVLVGRYQPIDKLNLTGKIIRSTSGEDDAGLNNGGNLLLSTDDRIGNLGNTIGQGVTTTNTYLELTGTYMLKHNLFIDFRNVLRNFDSAIDSRDLNSFITSISLRFNIAKREHEF